jgi:hypothetical protein
MTDHRHVVHVAFDDHFLDVDTLDVDNYDITLLVDSYAAGRISKSLLDRFARVGVLNLPDGLGVEGYDQVVDQMIDLVKDFSEDFGPPVAVVGLFEYTTLPAARLREHFAVPGVDVGTALRFRDKILMKQMLREVVPVPRFWPVGAATTAAELTAIVSGLPGKVVLKPTRQAASIGVRLFDRGADLLQYADAEGIQDGYEVEEFIEGTVCHVDGIVRDGRVLFLSAAEYFLGSCFTFQNSGVGPLASVTIDDSALVRRIADFTDRVLAALGLRDGSFHLELFLTPSGDLVFLEIANRFGGEYISRHLKTVYGVDLVQESIYCALSEKDRCRVRRVHGLDRIPSSVVFYDTPDIGQLLNHELGLAVASGRFILTGASTAFVKRDLRVISDAYSIDVEPDTP